MNKPIRKKSRARSAIHASRWASYTLAGAATALAASNDAEALVYYSGTIDKTIAYGGSHANFPLTTLHTHVRAHTPTPGSDWIGVFDAGFTHNPGFDAFDMSNKGAHPVGFKAGNYWYASKLTMGANIAAGPFTTRNPLGGGKIATLQYPGGGGQSKWTNFNGTAFLGFEFQNPVGQVQYGWARLTMYGGANNSDNYSYTIDDYAFGSPGQAMMAGVVGPAWTGAHDSNWNNMLNWSTSVVPGATGGSTTNTDTALFNQNATNQALVIDAGRNLQSIFFDSGGGALTTSLTVGTTTGNPLLLTSGGVIQTYSLVANAQTVNAPLVLEGTNGTYAFASNSSTPAATLNFGGAITAGASNGTTTLTLEGSNTGANTISGAIGNGANGATLGLTVPSGTWLLTGANNFTGASTISGGTLQLGSGGSLGATAIAVASGQLTMEAGSSMGATSISVTTGATFAVLPGSGALTAGVTGGGSSGATLLIGSGATFSMVDGAIGTFNLVQQSGFTGNPALTLAGGTLGIDLSSGGADKLALGVGKASVSGTNTVAINVVGTNLATGTYPIVTAPAGGLTGNFGFTSGAATENVSAGGHYYQLALNNSSTVESVTVVPSYTNFIILDTFSGSAGTGLASHAPDTNMPNPGGTYTTWGSTGHAQLTGGGQVQIGADIGAAVSINNAGSYIKPSVMTISAGLEVGGILGTDLRTNSGDQYRGVGVGFYPSAPSGVNAWSGFNGLVLNTDGSLTLGNTVGQTENSAVIVPWPTATLAAFSASEIYNVSYTINTAAGSGGISGVSVSNGAVTDTADFAAIDNYSGANIFTSSATGFAGFLGSSYSQGTYGYLSAFQLIATAASGSSIWTGANGSSGWADSGNWQNSIVPGSTVGTTDMDTATFSLNTTTSPLTIDAGRNLMNITFDTSAVSSNIIGTTSGNALLLTSGGTIQTTATVAAAQSVNAPLVLEGSYTFTSNASNNSATLNFGGQVTSGAASGTTTLTLNGSNAGANTISGALADGAAGSNLAVVVGGAGIWVYSGAAKTYSGGTTIAGGATLQLAGSTSQLSPSRNVANSGSLMVTSGNQSVGTVLGSGNVAVNGGSLTAYEIRQNSLTIGAGATVTLTASGSGSSLTNTVPPNTNNTGFGSNVASLTIAGATNAWTGTLDIGNNGLVIEYGNGANPFLTIENMVESGYNGGHWGGTGITSSLAAASISTNHPLNIGLEDFIPSENGFGASITFAGQTITTSAVLVRLTYMDDLVLAGDMSQNNATNDALAFAANYGIGTTWSVGDITHDGKIDSNDALLFAANYFINNTSSLDGASGAATSLGGTAAVPEPASLGLLAFGAAGLLAIRRRRGRKRRPALDTLATTELLSSDWDSEAIAPLTGQTG